MAPREKLRSILDTIPQQVQRQDSLDEQLRDLVAFANRFGMYDGADLLTRLTRTR